MDCIIAATDFSPNARAGLRFAIRMARATNARLVFLHVHYVLRASFWSDRTYEHYISISRQVLTRDLAAQVRSVYHDMKLPAAGYELAVYHYLSAAEGMIAYAVSRKASCICAGKRGTGGWQRLFGSTVAKLIRTSTVPVLSVPANYRTKAIRSVLYASDMADYPDELSRVVAFAKPLGARLDMLHLAHTYELMPDYGLLVRSMEELVGYPVHLITRPRNPELPVLEEIGAVVAETKPGVLVLFTDQHLSLIDRLFVPSNTRACAAHAAVPLLSFRKSAAPSRIKAHPRATGGHA